MFLKFNDNFQSDIFYHITCHQCIQCGRRISQGEQVCINEMAKSIACIAHAICNNDCMFACGILTFVFFFEVKFC